jgi:hypothetical protein
MRSTNLPPTGADLVGRPIGTRAAPAEAPNSLVTSGYGDKPALLPAR